MPADLADDLRDASASPPSTAPATATGTVDGVPRQTTLTIPKHRCPGHAGTTITSSAAAPAGPSPAGPPATTILLGAGDFTATLNGYNAAGGLVTTQTVTCTCTPGSARTCARRLRRRRQGADHDHPHRAEPPVEYGDRTRRDRRRRVHRQQRQAGRNRGVHLRGQDREGRGQGRQGQGHSRPGADHGARSVTAVFTPTDPNLAPSTATKAFPCRARPDHHDATAVYRDAATVSSARPWSWPERHCGRRRRQVRAEAQRRQDPDCDHELNSFDKAKKVFHNVSKPGRYKWSPATSAPTRSRGPSTGSS